MSWNKKLLFLSLLTISLSISAFSRNVPDPIVKAFGQGNAAVLAGYFNNTIELNIQGKENVYSSTQAEVILKNFFKSNPPKSFEIIHQGGQGESKYAIGILKTTKTNYRITLLIKSANNKPFIHQLRIEKDGV